MGRKFNIPLYYRSPIISTVKSFRRLEDSRKKDLSPTILDLGRVKFKIARHFGFCFGVENAIEIAYRAIEQNPDKRVFLLSEMIHNPHVNDDLQKKGVRFILATDGKQLIPFSEIRADDIVIVPAFGTTVELFAALEEIGIDPRLYNATCPFVEKVWKRAAELGGRGYTVIIHGKHYHEETKATFSHAKQSTPSIVIRDLDEAKKLSLYMRGELPWSGFSTDFMNRYSSSFDPETSLQRIGVVNQTTMLAGETQAISDLLREEIRKKYGSSNLDFHFADTRDTLCYATSENQEAIRALIESGGDLAIVVGGYNSSNTSHLVKLCQGRVPTYYIKDATEILSSSLIRNLELSTGTLRESSAWLPEKESPIEILISAGASCPDALVDEVIIRVASLVGAEQELDLALQPFRVGAESASNIGALA